MKAPLLEYLDKLEATAKAASSGLWSGRGWRILNEYGSEIAAGLSTVNEDHILATQPKATLALIAKMREAVDIVREATEIADRQYHQWVALRESPSTVINRFHDSVVAWVSIEVPS